MTIRNIAYVMFGAADVDRSIAFYRDALGLTVSGRFGKFAFLDTGGVMLVVTGELARSGPVPPEGCEVVFAVESVREAYDALKDRITFVNEPRPVNEQNWAVNFLDPDGHSLSLYGSE